MSIKHVKFYMVSHYTSCVHTHFWFGGEMKPIPEAVPEDVYSFNFGLALRFRLK